MESLPLLFLYLVIISTQQFTRVVQYTRSVTGRQTVFDPWRIVTARLFVSDRDRLRNFSWFCYGEGKRCRRIVPIGTDRDDPSLCWRMVTVRDGLSFFDRLRKYSWRCNGVRGGSGRIVTTRHGGDGWWRFVTVCLFSIDLESIHGGVMVCKEISADRPDRDGSWRPVTVVTDGDGSWRLTSFRLT